MGRPRKIEERRAQILEAFLASLVERGPRKTSLRAIAADLKLDRTTLHHYFRTKDDLLVAAMESLINAYQAQLDAFVAGPATPAERERLLLDFAFSPEFNDDHLSTLLNAFDDPEDPKAWRQMQRAYRMFEDVAVAEIEKRYPRAPAGERARAAYAIVTLSEGASSVAYMNLGSDRMAAARHAAELLLKDLTRWGPPAD